MAPRVRSESHWTVRQYLLPHQSSRCTCRLWRVSFVIIPCFVDDIARVWKALCETPEDRVVCIKFFSPDEDPRLLELEVTNALDVMSKAIVSPHLLLVRGCIASVTDGVTASRFTHLRPCSILFHRVGAWTPRDFNGTGEDAPSANRGTSSFHLSAISTWYVRLVVYACLTRPDSGEHPPPKGTCAWKPFSGLLLH